MLAIADGEPEVSMWRFVTDVDECRVKRGLAVGLNDVCADRYPFCKRMMSFKR